MLELYISTELIYTIVLRIRVKKIPQAIAIDVFSFLCPLSVALESFLFDTRRVGHSHERSKIEKCLMGMDGGRSSRSTIQARCPILLCFASFGGFGYHDKRNCKEKFDK